MSKDRARSRQPTTSFFTAWRECASSSSKRPSARQPVSFARSLRQQGAAQFKHQRGRITSPGREPRSTDRWCSHESCRRPLRRSSTQYGQTLSTQLRCRSTCWTIHQFAQRSTPPPIWYAHSGHSVCRGVPARSDVAGEDCDAHERREVHSTQPQQLADDLLDIAEARETESLKDVLIRLARQKKSGSIVLDGRRSTPSCRWSTFSSTVQTAPG